MTEPCSRSFFSSYMKIKKPRNSFLIDLTDLSQTYPLITMVTDRLHSIERYIDSVLLHEDVDIELLADEYEDEDDSEATND